MYHFGSCSEHHCTSSSPMQRMHWNSLLDKFQLKIVYPYSSAHLLLPGYMLYGSADMQTFNLKYNIYWWAGETWLISGAIKPCYRARINSDKKWSIKTGSHLSAIEFSIGSTDHRVQNTRHHQIRLIVFCHQNCRQWRSLTNHDIYYGWLDLLKKR